MASPCPNDHGSRCNPGEKMTIDATEGVNLPNSELTGPWIMLKWTSASLLVSVRLGASILQLLLSHLQNTILCSFHGFPAHNALKCTKTYSLSRNESSFISKPFHQQFTCSCLHTFSLPSLEN